MEKLQEPEIPTKKFLEPKIPRIQNSHSKKIPGFKKFHKQIPGGEIRIKIFFEPEILIKNS